MERIRKSYQSQLENSIQVIAGEYKVSHCVHDNNDILTATSLNNKFTNRLTITMY